MDERKNNFYFNIENWNIRWEKLRSRIRLIKPFDKFLRLMMWSINVDAHATDGFLISAVALHNNHVFVIAYKLGKM